MYTHGGIGYRHILHKCTTICLGVANRPNYEFSKGYDKEMNGLIEYVLGNKCLTVSKIKS